MTDPSAPQSPHGFSRRPMPKSIGNAARGQAIVAGAAPVEPHGFGWLDDLAAVGTAPARSRAQDGVLGWLKSHAKVPVTPPPGDESPEWRVDLTGRRVLRWVFHGGLVLPGLDRAASTPFFESLHAQLAYLAANWSEAAPGLPRTEALAGLAIAALALKGAEPRVAPALEALAREAAGFDGAIPSRAPEELLNSFALLGWVREAARDAGVTPPEGLAEAIDRIAPVLRALRHADGGLARFHGGGRGAPGRLDHALRAARGPAELADGLVMGFARLARGRTSVIVDAAQPPGGPAAASAHASTLAFEMTVGRHPLVVNCGTGRGFGPPWSRAARATPSHSTLSLTGLSSARLLAPATPGGPEFLTEPPAHVWAGTPDEDDALGPPALGPAHAHEAAHLLTGHDGYHPSHGLLHTRELWLEPDGERLAGEDSLLALSQEERARLASRPDRDRLSFDIRFHLHPALRADQRSDEILLTLPDDSRWVFRHDRRATLSLEASAWLEPGEAAPLPCWQIVLHAPLWDEACQIGWTFAKASVRASPNPS